MSTSFPTIPAAVVTYAVPLAYAGPHDSNRQIILASVAGAGATATTFVLNCLPWEAQVCGIRDLSLTVGPWARMTPPPAVATGSFDIIQPVLVESIIQSASNHAASETMRNWTTSVHCEMTQTTQPSTCTTAFQPDLNASTPITAQTFATPAFWSFGALPAPITITAGLDKLASLLPSSAISLVLVSSPSETYGTYSVSISATSDAPIDLTTDVETMPTATDTGSGTDRTLSSSASATTTTTPAAPNPTRTTSSTSATSSKGAAQRARYCRWAAFGVLGLTSVSVTNL